MMMTSLNEAGFQPDRPDVRATPGLTSGPDDGSSPTLGDGMRALALGEMARRRRRLGSLTPEQERALESLMVSIADNIFSLVSDLTDSGREVR